MPPQSFVTENRHIYFFSASGNAATTVFFLWSSKRLHNWQE